MASSGEIIQHLAHHFDAQQRILFLFIMEDNHDKTLVREEGLYRRCCAVIEAVKSRINGMKENDEFIHRMQYAQCDLSMMNSMQDADHCVNRWFPLEHAYFGTLRAGKCIPVALCELLRQSAADGHMLVPYQCNYTSVFARLTPGYNDERRQAIVLATELPQSSSLIVERHPNVRGGLQRSRFFTVLLLTAAVDPLYGNPDFTVHHHLLG